MNLAETIMEIAQAAAGDTPVYDGFVPAPSARPDRYVVAYIPPEVVRAGDVGVTPNGRHITWQLTFVASAPSDALALHAAWQARHLANHVVAQLVTQRLVPAGSKISQTYSSGPTRDEQVTSKTVLAVMVGFEALT